MDFLINCQWLTHNIANKGFSGVRRFVARFNFLCTLTGNRPQSLTGHIVNVIGHSKKKRMLTENREELSGFLVELTNMLRQINFIFELLLKDSLFANFV